MENKVLVVVSRSLKARETQIARWLVESGFARYASDAKKIIYDEIPSHEIDSRFFIAWKDVDIHEDIDLMPRLVKKAMMGHFVAIGTRYVPSKQFSWACNIVKIETNSTMI